MMGTRIPSKAAMVAVLAGICLVAGVGAQDDVPRYKVDPFWPKTLPHSWLIGHIEQIVIDRNDHIWVLNHTNTMEADDAGLAQSPKLSDCCLPSPQVLIFNTDGEVINHWGTRGWVPEWPEAVHAMALDQKGNVWIAGNHAPDRAALKFDRNGKHLMTIGRKEAGPPNNQDTTLLGGPASMLVDDSANELYVADGYLNKRVVVYDSETGKFKRGWGAYGKPLSEIDNQFPTYADKRLPQYVPGETPAKDFRGPVVGLRLSNDNILYVTDRTSNRVQLFTKQGKFIREHFIAPKTLASGAPMAMAFSKDPQQRLLFVADGGNQRIRILNRADFKELSAFGHRGHNAGQFAYLDAIALDSQSNLYTGEVRYNNRVQKFILQK